MSTFAFGDVKLNCSELADNPFVPLHEFYQVYLIEGPQINKGLDLFVKNVLTFLMKIDDRSPHVVESVCFGPQTGGNGVDDPDSFIPGYKLKARAEELSALIKEEVSKTGDINLKLIILHNGQYVPMHLGIVFKVRRRSVWVLENDDTKIPTLIA